MKVELHPSSERGHAGYGWLDTYHSFSFANYFNPVRERFGALRVLNDDTIAPGAGFDEHPHDNMEIITIVLGGALEHRDSMGNTEVIRAGEVQVMSAGTGIRHAEYCHSQEEPATLLQIWIFPDQRGLTPRYEQRAFEPSQRKNAWQTLVTPHNRQQEKALWIHQDAWLSVAGPEAGAQTDYSLHQEGNGLFLFVIEGSAEVEGYRLGKRDAIAISGSSRIGVKALENAEILGIEVPVK